MILKKNLSQRVLDFLIVNKTAMFRGEYRDSPMSLCTYQYAPPGSAYWMSKLSAPLNLPKIPTTETIVSLYEYQKEVFDKMNGARAGLIKAPTGSGKSVVITAMAESWEGKTLILLHNTELCTQQVEVIEKFSGKKSGIYYSKEKSIKDITCVTYASFRAHPELFADFDQMLVDECDMIMTSKLRKLINAHGAIRKVGFTATDKKTDYDVQKLLKKGASGQKYKSVVYRAKDDPEYINAVVKYWGYKVEMKSTQRKYALKNVYIGETKNDYSSMEYEVIDESTGVVMDSVPVTSKNWIQYRDCLDNSLELIAEKANFILSTFDPKVASIAFFDRVEECQRMCTFLKTKKDIDCHLMYGKTKKKDRLSIKNSVEKNGGLIIAHPTLVGRGWDLPRLKRGYVLCPIADQTTTEQLIGRMAREWMGESGEIFDLKIKGLNSQFKQRTDLYKSKKLKIIKL